MVVWLNIMKHPSHAVDEDWMEELLVVTNKEGTLVRINGIVPYGTAIKDGLLTAGKENLNIAFCDSDGYHPVPAILKLCHLLNTLRSPWLVKPYRANIPFQSNAFSCLYNLWTGEKINDATGGLWGMTSSAASEIGPRLEAADMTVHLEVEHQAHLFNFPILQFPYFAGKNRTAESRRTEGYRWKLLKKLFQL